MRVLDLFSGIGGFSLGLERAGMTTAAFCEIDPYCRAVLKKWWPDVPCFEDIAGLSADRLARLGRIDLVCGGFPCQPFSHAGKQRAKADARHLWPQMCRVTALTRPDWFVGENVTGIITLALDDVLADLESIGYAARPFVIPAVAVDAKHRRDRVWIVARNAHRESESARASDAAEVAELRGDPATDADGGELRNESGRRGGPSGEDPAEPRDDGAQRPAADADGAGLEGRIGAILQERGAERPAGSSSASAADATGVQRPALFGNEPHGDVSSDGSTTNAARGRRGKGSKNGGRGGEGNGADQRPRSAGRCWWLPEPDVGRVAHGIPSRVDRLRCLGNAVVPQIVEEIGRAILQCQGGR
jgi:DNA (cytosine-5)-methyltransferase 1